MHKISQGNATKSRCRLVGRMSLDYHLNFIKSEPVSFVSIGDLSASANREYSNVNMPSATATYALKGPEPSGGGRSVHVQSIVKQKSDSYLTLNVHQAKCFSESKQTGRYNRILPRAILKSREFTWHPNFGTIRRLTLGSPSSSVHSNASSNASAFTQSTRYDHIAHVLATLRRRQMSRILKRSEISIIQRHNDETSSITRVGL